MGGGTRLDGSAPVSERGAATLEIVLRASTEMFAERGVAATTMRQLAGRAGLPMSTFYYYFSAKYDVLVAIMDAAMARLEAGIDDAWDEGLGADEQLRDLVASHVRVHLSEPDAAKVADRELRSLAPADRARMVERRDAYERIFRDVLERGRQSGVFASELDVSLAAISIITMSTSVVDWWRPGGRLGIEATAELLGAFSVSVARNCGVAG